MNEPLYRPHILLFGRFSFGSYMKIFFIAAVSYAVVTTVLSFGKLLWLVQTGDDVTVRAAKVIIPVMLISPVSSILQVLIMGLVGYPLYSLICSKRGGIFMKGDFSL